MALQAMEKVFKECKHDLIMGKETDLKTRFYYDSDYDSLLVSQKSGNVLSN